MSEPCIGGQPKAHTVFRRARLFSVLHWRTLCAQSRLPNSMCEEYLLDMHMHVLCGAHLRCIHNSKYGQRRRHWRQSWRAWRPPGRAYTRSPAPTRRRTSSPTGRVCTLTLAVAYYSAAGEQARSDGMLTTHVCVETSTKASQQPQCPGLPQTAWQTCIFCSLVAALTCRESAPGTTHVLLCSSLRIASSVCYCKDPWHGAVGVLLLPVPTVTG